MWIRTVDYILAAAGVAGHIVLLAILVRRRLLARVPWFVLLIGFYLIRSLLFMVSHFPATWPRTYWLLIYLDPGLQLLLMLALAGAAWRFGRAKIALALPVMVAIALMAAWHLGASRDTPANLALKLSMFVSALWIMIAGALALWLRTAAADTKRFPLGIALGFAVYSAANIATEIVHMQFVLHPQPSLFTALSFFRALVYLGCLAGWSFLFDVRFTRDL